MRENTDDKNSQYGLFSLSVTHFMPLVSFTIPPEHIRKPEVLDAFRGYRRKSVA